MRQDTKGRLRSLRRGALLFSILLPACSEPGRVIQRLSLESEASDRERPAKIYLGVEGREVLPGTYQSRQRTVELSPDGRISLARLCPFRPASAQALGVAFRADDATVPTAQLPREAQKPEEIVGRVLFGEERWQPITGKSGANGAVYFEVPLAGQTSGGPKPQLELPAAATIDMSAQCWEPIPGDESIEIPPVRLGARPRLTFALGLLEPTAMAEGTTVRYSILAETSQEAKREVFSTILSPTSTEAQGWIEASVDLTDFRGEIVRFTLRTEAPVESLATPLWSVPVVESDGPRSGAQVHNVILISLDTLSARHMDLYGYERRTTPRLREFAQRATVFDNAYSQSPWTTPAHASILSGQAPHQHGAGIAGRGFHPPPGSETLAEKLRDQGFRTAAFTEGGAIIGSTGLDRGFDLYSNGNDSRETQFIETTLSRAEGWLNSYGSAPFFLFVHTYEPHWPYESPPEFASQFGTKPFDSGVKPWWHEISEEEKQRVTALYDAGIAYTDYHLGEFLDRLQTEGWLDQSLVIMLSDHGEEFWEHGGWGHLTNYQIYDEVLHVPLLVRLPLQQAGQRISHLVSTTDVFATVLDFLTIDHPTTGHSRSLLPFLREDVTALDDRRVVLSQLVADKKQQREAAGGIFQWTLLSLRSQREKYIMSNRESILGWLSQSTGDFAAAAKDFGEEYYRLDKDPGEQIDLSANHEQRTQEIRSLIEAMLRADKMTPSGLSLKGADEAEPLDDELKRQLEALGYL